MGAVIGVTIGETIVLGDVIGFDVASGKWKKSGNVTQHFWHTQGAALEDGVNNEIIQAELFGHVVNLPVDFTLGPLPLPTAGYIMQPCFDLGFATIAGTNTSGPGSNPLIGYLLENTDTDGKICPIFVPDSKRSIYLNLANVNTATQVLNDMWYDRLADAVNRHLILTGVLPSDNKFFGFTHQADLTTYHMLVSNVFLSTASGDARLKIKTYAGGTLVDDTGYFLLSMTANAPYLLDTFMNVTDIITVDPAYDSITVDIERDGGHASDTIGTTLYTTNPIVMF